MAMARCLFPHMVLLGMREREPLHEEGEIAIYLWVEDHMPMVGHEDVGQHAHVEFLDGFLEKHFEMYILIARFKYRAMSVCTVDDVIREITNVDSWSAAHLQSIHALMVPDTIPLKMTSFILFYRLPAVEQVKREVSDYKRMKLVILRG